MAEHVFAFLIGLSKHFPRMMTELARGNYAARTSLTGCEIAGKTLGIIGFGRIGRRVGEIAHLGFGMKVFYHDIVPASEEIELRAERAERVCASCSALPISSRCTCPLMPAPGE